MCNKRDKYKFDKKYNDIKQTFYAAKIYHIIAE